jgi:hypothetical protein
MGISGSNRIPPYLPTPVSGVNDPSKNGVLYLLSNNGAAEIRDGLSNAMLIGEYSGLTTGQAFSGSGSLGDNDGTWNLGAGTNGTAYAQGFATRVIGFPPNSRAYWKSALCCVECDAPAPNTYEQQALKSSHPGGIGATMADGSVTFIGDGINMEVFKDLADREDGHPLGQL